MDRFKSSDNTSDTNETSIYIPLWIDLNLKLLITLNYFITNLHSTMDRFKSYMIKFI